MSTTLPLPHNVPKPLHVLVRHENCSSQKEMQLAAAAEEATPCLLFFFSPLTFFHQKKNRNHRPKTPMCRMHDASIHACICNPYSLKCNPNLKPLPSYLRGHRAVRQHVLHHARVGRVDEAPGGGRVCLARDDVPLGLRAVLLEAEVEPEAQRGRAEHTTRGEHAAPGDLALALASPEVAGVGGRGCGRAILDVCHGACCNTREIQAGAGQDFWGGSFRAWPE